MNLPAIARIPLVVLLLCACSVGPAALPTASQAPTASAAPTPASEPTATVGATSIPTVAATRPTATESPLPQGVLSGLDETAEGWLGSYCWEGTCADAPETPPMVDLPYVSGDRDLVFSLSDGLMFVRWRASYTSPHQTESVTLGQGGEAPDPDASPGVDPPALTSATFASPPGGDWIVMVQVFLENGDLSYAWYVDVQRVPPTGEMVLPDADIVEGHRGSWCYDSACADLPALPKSSMPLVRIGPRESLTFRLAEGHEFGYASASYSADNDSADAHVLSTVGVSDPDSLPTAAPPLSIFEFEGPPRGDWALVVFVHFPKNGGDASYYWHLIAD